MYSSNNFNSTYVPYFNSTMEWLACHPCSTKICRAYDHMKKISYGHMITSELCQFSDGSVWPYEIYLMVIRSPHNIANSLLGAYDHTKFLLWSYELTWSFLTYFLHLFTFNIRNPFSVSTYVTQTYSNISITFHKGLILALTHNISKQASEASCHTLLFYPLHTL